MYTVKGLIEAGAIYLEHIQDGFDNYDYQVVTMSQEEAYDTIKSLWVLNGPHKSYADFYYYKLEEEARNKVNAALDEKEIEYLKDGSNSHIPENMIYPLDDILLGILIKLNYSETLFSTFYFTKEPCTWWGNYNHEYVVFHNK